MITSRDSSGTRRVRAAAGHGPSLSAKALEQAIDRLLVHPMRRALPEGGFAEGTAVRVDAHEGELLLEDAVASAPWIWVAARRETSHE